ncbi:MAG TPA: hypothetical protein VFZ53_05035 [Polyangiaceae bacterium]
MTEPSDEFTPEEKRLAALLLKSATLDRPDDATKQRSLEAGLAAVAERRPPRRAKVVAGAVLALAAGVAFFIASRGDDQANLAAERLREVAPESSRPAPATSAVVAPRRECPKLVVARGDAPLLDDWEEDDSRLAPLDGRGGNWITYDDRTGKQTRPDKSPLFPTRVQGGRGASTRALHMMGGKFKTWGVTFGAELADAACYDAAAYAGIEFWAKGSGSIKVGLQMIDVQDEKYGGFCKTDCYNTHRKVVGLTRAWKHYVVRWEELAQLYQAGPPLGFDPARVRFIEFGIGPESTPFDLWIDDVAFVKR